MTMMLKPKCKHHNLICDEERIFLSKKPAGVVKLKGDGGVLFTVKAFVTFLLPIMNLFHVVRE